MSGGYHAESYTVRLIVWSPSIDTELPFGAPGDPATDYTTFKDPLHIVSACGVRKKDAAVPYTGAWQARKLVRL